MVDLEVSGMVAAPTLTHEGLYVALEAQRDISKRKRFIEPLAASIKDKSKFSKLTASDSSNVRRSDCFVPCVPSTT